VLSGVICVGRGSSATSAVVLDTEAAQEVITDLLKVLERAGLLHVTDTDRDSVPGYRVNAGALRWLAGDGESAASDPLRRTVVDEAGARVNPFFRNLYRDVSRSLVGLVAREHTAQVPPAVRQNGRRTSAAGGCRCCSAHRRWSSAWTSPA